MVVQTDTALAAWSTMGVGGPARFFRAAQSEDDVIAALSWARDRDVEVFVLGGGSNIVIADEGFDGLVVQIAISGVDARQEGSGTVFRVGSGEPWDPFVARAIDLGCGGVECLSGIPGLVGGTPVQNVGAYGQDVSETIRTVRVVDRATQTARTMPASECGFGYRTSRFKHADAGRFIVTGVEFVLPRDGAPTITYADVVKFFEQHGPPHPSLLAVRDAILQIRRRKGMVIEEGNPANRSCGSFFVNPVITTDHFAQLNEAPHYPVGDGRVKVPAAWLIERAGFPKGYARGPVGISPFQSQAIINRGGAAARDVLALAVAVKRAVWNSFRIALVPEPVFVGFGENQEVRYLINPHPHVHTGH